MTSDQKEIERLKHQRAGMQKTIFDLVDKLALKESRIEGLQAAIFELMKEIKP